MAVRGNRHSRRACIWLWRRLQNLSGSKTGRPFETFHMIAERLGFDPAWRLTRTSKLNTKFVRNKIVVAWVSLLSGLHFRISKDGQQGRGQLRTSRKSTRIGRGPFSVKTLDALQETIVNMCNIGHVIYLPRTTSTACFHSFVHDRATTWQSIPVQLAKIISTWATDCISIFSLFAITIAI